MATTSIISLAPNGDTAGVGKSHVDNVYVVAAAENIQRTIRLDASGVGIGTTVCRRVSVNINDSFGRAEALGITTQTVSTVAGYGEYSWGRASLAARAGLNSYTAYTNDGVLGITTSMRVERSAPLKFKNYIT